MIDLTGLNEYRDSPIRRLSGGTQKRLYLAQALLHDPPILVLDEPMSGLDPGSRFRFKEIIRELRLKNRVIFFSSHILADVADLADRIAILNQGKVVRIGAPEALTRQSGIGQIVAVEFSPKKTTQTDSRGRTNSDFRVDGVDRIEEIAASLIHIHLRVDADLDTAIGQILKSCVDNHIRVRGVRHLRPDLESVYLRLTEGTK